MQSNQYLTDKQVAERFSVHRATPWRWVERGDFPKPVRLSPGCTRWRESDIQAWEETRNGERQPTPANDAKGG